MIGTTPSPASQDPGRDPTLVAGVLLCLAAGFTVLEPVRSFDLFWHLHVAAETLEHRWFSFPESTALAARDQYVNLHWGWNVPMLLLYRLGGLPALVLATGALATASAAAVWLLARRACGAHGRWTALALTAAVVAATHWRFNVRPQALFLVLLPVVLLAGRRLRSPTSPSTRMLLGIGALLLFWAHSHASIIIAPAVVLAASLDWQVSARGDDPGGRWLALPRPELRVMLLLAFACVVPLLGPQGPELVATAVTHAGGDAPAHVLEAQPMRSDWWFPPVDASAAIAEALTLLALLGFVRKRKVPLGLAALVVMGLVLTVMWHRFRATWALMALPAVAWGWRPERAEVEGVMRKVLAVAALAVALAVLTRGSQAPDFRLDETLYPVGATDVLVSQGIEGPVFARHRAGGYLEWALRDRVRVALDGRTPLHFNADEFFAARHARSDPQVFRSLDRAHDFVAALLPRREPLCPSLLEDPGWTPVWVGERQSLFLTEPERRRVGLPAVTWVEVCDGSQVARCRAEPEGVGPTLAEIDRLSALSPTEAWLPRLAAVLHFQCPETSPDAAGSWIDRAHALDPDHPDLPWLEAQLLLVRSDPEGAEATLALAEGHVEAMMLRLRVLRGLDRPHDAYPLGLELLALEDDRSGAELRRLAGWACEQVGDGYCASSQAVRGALLGDPEAEAVLRRLLESGQLEEGMVPLGRGVLGTP